MPLTYSWATNANLTVGGLATEDQQVIQDGFDCNGFFYVNPFNAWANEVSECIGTLEAQIAGLGGAATFSVVSGSSNVTVTENPVGTFSVAVTDYTVSDDGNNFTSVTEPTPGDFVIGLNIENVATGVSTTTAFTNAVESEVANQINFTDTSRVGAVWTQEASGAFATVTLPAGGQWRAIVIMGGNNKTGVLLTGSNSVQSDGAYTYGFDAGLFPGGTSWSVSATNAAHNERIIIYAQRVS